MHLVDHFLQMEKMEALVELEDSLLEVEVVLEVES